MKRKTVGVDPKVPVQAAATVIVWLLAYFGVDMDVEVASALAVLLGAGAGALAPAPQVTVDRDDVKAAVLESSRRR